MTDLEMTKLCAEAMGYEPVAPSVTGKGIWLKKPVNHRIYDPLHDDAQAMALVKDMSLDIIWGPGELRWQVSQWCSNAKPREHESRNMNLNRAICECVAKMQKEKVAA